MASPATTGRFAFRATLRDLQHLETIALALRNSGRPFATRTDALRLCLAVAAADPASLQAVAAK